MTPNPKTECKLIMLWGLPGSGKTTYANSLVKQAQFRHPIRVVSVDEIQRHQDQIDIDNVVLNIFENFRHGNKLVVLDGLITTNELASAIIDRVNNQIKQYTYEKFDLVVEVVWWKPDREACLHNDRKRRHLSAGTTIKNMPFEEPASDKLPTCVSKISGLEVVRKSNVAVWADENFAYHKDYILTSSSWCLGGTYGTCWGTSGTVSPEAQPQSFAELDEYLEKICPNLTFMQYKRIQNECVSIETKGESDYYGGSTTSAYFSCNLIRLHEVLKEMNII